MIKSINLSQLKNSLLGVLISGLLLLDSLNVLAMRIPYDMNTQIIMTTNKLEEILKDNYELQLKQLKKRVNIDNYDYELTMESLAEKGNIFSDADYIELIAAYITITNNHLSVVDINFFNITTTEASITEKKPYKYYKYEKNEDGTYDRKSVQYLLDDGKVGVYKENSDGTYSYEKDEQVTLEEREISYLDTSISLITPEEMMEKYGSGYEAEEDEYKSRLEILKAAGVSARGLRESIMLILYQELILTEEEAGALSLALSVEDPNRKAIIETASSLIGKVPYQWGGKSKMDGYDTSWWTFNEAGEQMGLDCSGFVQWVYRSSGYPNYTLLTSTATILNNTEDITQAELQPGDIGLLNHGESTNHTGIYLGDGYFIHCSSSKNTVVISKFPFTIFKRVSGLDEQTLTAYHYVDETKNYTSEDVLLVSKLVSQESAGEGLNGWVAVTQVLMNRVNSPLFPNSFREVIYQGVDSGIKQFSNVEEIDEIVPSENIISVVEATLSGKIKILNNENVLYFRNPYEEDMNDWGTHKTYTRINNHVFYLQ